MKQQSNSRNRDTRPGTATLDESPSPETPAIPHMRQVLTAMVAFRDGNFSVRLPAHWSGIEGRIAEAFNQTIDHEDTFRAKSRSSVSRSVKKDA